MQGYFPMSKARYLPKRDYDGLKAVSRDLVEAAGGSKRVCELTRACPSRLSEALAPQCDERFLAIDQVADLEADCGEPVVTRVLADMIGCDVVTRDAPKSRASIRALIAAVTKESAEVTARFLEATDDNSLSAEERVELRREVEEAIEQLNSLRVTLAVEPALRAVG